jgi:hypothetical protein
VAAEEAVERVDVIDVGEEEDGEVDARRLLRLLDDPVFLSGGRQGLEGWDEGGDESP